MMRKALRLGFPLAFVLWPNALLADTVTYNYTGNPFTEAAGVYSTNDALTLSLTLSTTLPSDQAYADDTSEVTSFTASDGIRQISSAAGGSGNFYFATTAGSIVAWLFNISDGNGGTI